MPEDFEGAPNTIDPKRRSRPRLAAGLALLLLALLFVAQSPRGEGETAGGPSPSPSPTASPAESQSAEPGQSSGAGGAPSPVPTADPSGSEPSRSPNPTVSSAPLPSDYGGAIGTCSDSVDIGLESDWSQGRFIVRTIAIDVPTADCDGVRAQVLLLDADDEILLRRDGIVEGQRLLFNILDAELDSLRVKGTAFELTSSGNVPVNLVTPSRLDLQLDGVLGASVDSLAYSVTGSALAPRSEISLQVDRSSARELVGDDGAAALKGSLASLRTGKYIITARAAGTAAALTRRAFVEIDALRRIVVLIRDYDGWLLSNDLASAPTSPVRTTDTTILVAEDGRLVYLDERTSTSSWAAHLGTAQETLSRPQVLLGGLLSGTLIALVGLIAGLTLDIIRAKVRSAFEAVIGGLRLPDYGAAIPNILGFRLDVIPFLLVGQIIAALNAPLELIPPPLQLLQAAVYGAIAVVIVSEFSRLPRINYMRKNARDIGVFVGRWWSLVLAVAALVLSHAAHIVPGIIVGLIATRRFRVEVGAEDDAGVTFQSSLLQASAAAVAWLAIDLITTILPDAESPLRAISDGILSTIVVAGSHGLLATLVNPTDKGAVALRRTSPVRWLGMIAASGVLVVGIISTGGSAESLFGAQVSLPQLALLAVISIIVVVAALVATRKPRESANAA